mmetsp:Transcript_14950/g.31291  ORF Transcript_14950/g.31291 Transcript_14950/m.31291 type:complete len:450 (+) Transcript_14950:173-1522(+)
MNSPSTPPLLTPSELQRFEAPLIALANMSNGDLRKLFYAFFSFLHRRTDFYCVFPDDDGVDGSSGAAATGRRNMGFKPGQAEQILLASFRQFPLRKVGHPPAVSASAVSKTRASKIEASPKTETDKVEKSNLNNETIKNNSKIEIKDKESSSADDETIQNSTEVTEVGTAAKTSSDSDGNVTDSQKTNESTVNDSCTNNTTIRYTEDGKQIPVGNGGSTSRYVWTQTLDEVTIHIPLPHGIRGKDLDVKIGASSLGVKLKNNNDELKLEPLEGTLFGKIRPSESTWTFETTSSAKTYSRSRNPSNNDTNSMTTLQIILEKTTKTWWATILSGDPIVDTTLVDSTRKIDTYDEKTQAQIRRIMFDQRQERLGLPKSDEILGEAVKLPPFPGNAAGSTSVNSESVEGIAEGVQGLNVQEVGDGKVKILPEGVEFIDQETLDRAFESKSKYA